MHEYIFVSLFLLSAGVVISELLNRPEGAPCTWQERSGKCTHIFKCYSSLENIKKKNYPPICSFKGKEPVVCCTDCRLAMNDTRNIINDPEVGILIKTGSRVVEKCYDFLQTLDYPCKKAYKLDYEYSVDKKKNCNNFNLRRTNVNNTLLKSLKEHFPHMAYLGYGESIEKTSWLCGGTVISERFILTAAVCVNPDISIGQVKKVALSIHKRWVSPAEWQQYNVKRAIPHPEFNPPSKYHDIALVETDKSITFGPNVLPACLDTGILLPGAHSDVTAMIWTDGDNGTLDFVPLSNFDELECSLFYPLQRTLTEGYNHTIQMCAGDRQPPKDTCDGEIGSPLQSSFKFCTQVIRGVASIQRICGEVAGSGLYTRVSYYVPWIESIVWPSRHLEIDERVQ